MPKTLKECCDFLSLPCVENRIIHRVSHDSRECDEASIYCGNMYQEDALKRKAYVIEECYLGELLNFFYDDPSQHYFVIGVTGTNGKTSMTHFLKQAYQKMGYRCIRLGTHMNEFEDEMIETKNTTMDVMKNLEVFLKYKNDIDVLIMEVSSHAIEENRIAFIRFDRIIYTNLASDHLDYHRTFTQYKSSKFKLRFYLKKQGLILMNYDHFLLHELLRYTRNVLSIGERGRIRIQKLKCDLNGSRFMVGDDYYRTTMLGEHNLMNLAMVVVTLKSMNIEVNEEVIFHIEECEGRMESFIVEERRIVIDYAHTYDALLSVLAFLQKVCDSRIVTVMGCGGNRDRSKRAQMAQVAMNFSDLLIVTEDNNRDEDFHQIVLDMQLERFLNVVVVEKRENAINLAFHLSCERDIILLAGKGNEKFLIANGVKTPYNDKEFILKRGY